MRAFRGEAALDEGRTSIRPTCRAGRDRLAALKSLLTCLFAGACLTFGVIAWLSATSRRVTSRIVLGLGVCTAVAVACLATFAAEYDGFVLTPLWRLAPWMLVIGAMIMAAGEFTGRRHAVAR
ncbi:hypothetical protein [Micrococcus luteus]|uniref:hypothetical protein n=1 Tax=Micrococcus luteus TaxID=1270 RepID=UPI002891D2EA|nr:hypothetical protein [Micrococcus luteus]MDT1992331.1 hypothetical protein [Micrococcus luteus]